jgi:DivIVA domain-containing protein
MRKRKDESDVSESAAGVPQGRLTPTDIQEKVFRSQPGLHGYNEREVDEFLDRITEELARVHAENQRLREQLAGGAAAVPAGAAATGPQIGSDYIAREKEFLRSLATLIQSHAEAVRQDVRRATGPGATAAATVPAAAPAPAPTPAVRSAEPVPPAAAPLAEAPQPALDTSPRELDPVGVAGEPPPQDETIRELFWGED